MKKDENGQEKTARLRERTTRSNKIDRKKRVPLGTPHRKLMMPNIPEDKVGRWVNDKPGRLQQAHAGGYEFVSDPNLIPGEGHQGTHTDLGSVISTVVDSETGMRAYFMVIDKDLYEEDQATKQAEIDRTDVQIKTGNLANKLGEHGYVPEGGIKYDQPNK